MIISYSGKIGSGKDLCGQITRYLISQKRAIDGTFAHLDIEPSDIDHWTLDHFIDISGYSTKKFAGKVKEICSILTGIPVTDFEKQEVKDRVLGEEWDRIVDFNGLPLNNPSDGILLYRKHLTIRQLLQQVGTDAMRNVIHENVWGNALFAEYKPTGFHHSMKNPETDWDIYPNWIITDTRFENEAEAIKSRGGLLIRINRPYNHNCSFKDSCKGSLKEQTCGCYNEFMQHNQHQSEITLDNYTGFDETIINDGTIEELIEQVKLILIKHNIL